jgi:protoporphyrinogen oxidase
MPIPLMERVKLGLRLLRIKRRYGELADMPFDLSNPRVRELCARTLEDFVGARHPDVKALWDALSMASNTLPSNEVAALQPINTFVHFAAEEYYVEGGTWELTRALWKAVDEKTETSAEVEDVSQQNGTVRVTYSRAGRHRTVEARRCVIAAQAPLALPMVKDVPDWKRDALSSVYFGSMTSAGFLLSENSERFLPEGVWRVPVVGKKFMSVTNPTFTFSNEVKQRTGQGLLRVYTGDEVSKELQQMSDGEAMEVLSDELTAVLPDIKGKIITGSIKHWEHGIPAWRLGRLDMAEAITAPTGRIHYCGDYTVNSGLEAAVLSAHRVLDELGER